MTSDLENLKLIITVTVPAAVNGESSMKVISSNTTATTASGYGVTLGSTFTVAAGNRYRVRVKGYRTTNPVYLQITAGSTILNSPGTALPINSTLEGWVEQVVTIPTSTTTMKVGLVWGSNVAANEIFYVNEVEVSQLTTQAAEYQYNLKDHLGNVRVTFTTRQDIQTYLATFEDAVADAKVFQNVNTSTMYWVSKTAANNTSPGQYVMRMNNSYMAGPAKTIKVYAGDVIVPEVWSYFEGTSGFGSTNQSVSSLITSVAAAFGGVSGGTGESGLIYNGVSAAYAGYGSPGNQGDGSPTAHLNYILFDKDYNVLDMGWKPVPSSANFAKQNISFNPITFKEIGYMYVYLTYSGVGTNWVYFDDLKITQTKSAIIAGNDYYPFGLTYNSFLRENSVKQDYLYNGKEQQDELNLSWLDYGARMYIPEIGRGYTQDPKAEKYRRWSLYNYCVNNPIRVIDPDGMDIVYIDMQGNETGRQISETNSVYLVSQRPVPFTSEIDGYSAPIYTKVSISMSYSGNMSDENTKMSSGVLSINATTEDGNIIALSSYSADSGPSGVGSIPDGDYTASGITNASEKGMKRDGVGFKVFLSDNSEKCRTDLRIHPDGTEYVGTAGCIGLTESKAKLNDFKTKMGSFFKDGSTVNVNVNITSNANLSDCDAKGKKKSKGGAAGN